jgi:hypothetical protein
MKQRIMVLFLIVGLVVVLAALNAASFVQTPTIEDSELNPNRSTYNPGSTGTEAFFTLLSETGRKPVRWQESPDALFTTKNKPSVFVMIGRFRRDITENESTSLLRWVSQGGRLVIIDREPPKDLCTSTANWKIWISSDPAIDLFSVDPSDQKQMTSGVDAAKPVQPTIFTANVNGVQPSRFAGWINFERYNDARRVRKPPSATDQPPPPPRPRRQLTGDNNKKLEPPVVIGNSNKDEDVYEPTTVGPVVHLVGSQKNLLVDVPLGSGSIAYLTDPYIVSNGGIGIVDNAQLALNLVSTKGGPIAFDEYHQGYSSNSNRLFEYFAGTPVISIFLQCSLFVGLILLSQSRRFARALPERGRSRLSKLEYVTAMAELQQRTRAYDLAMENIYTDFRRRLSRALGFDNRTSTRREIARLIAERGSLDADSVEALMLKCEEIVHGEPTNKDEIVSLTARLREVEQKLGIRRMSKGNGGQ